MNVTVDKNSSIPIQEQLIGQLGVIVRFGKLKSGDVLPTVKELAKSLNINYNTVAAAYRTLQRRGYLEQHRRGGTRVAEPLPEDPATDLLTYQTAAVAAQLKALSDDTPTLMNLLAAHLALGKEAPALRVAVVARTPLTAARAAARTQTILGDGYACVPQTPEAFRSADYHLTVVDPDLLIEAERSAFLPYREVHNASFPAGAD